ncbi:MAG: DUF402 domain-containing protein [Thermoplasmata archaeon]
MVIVRYNRIGKRGREWEHELLLDNGEIIISSFEFKLAKPFSPLGRPLIRSGYRGILFDHFEKWYNVIEVRDPEGKLKGYYSDIRTPPVRTNRGYEATDLILDIWVSPDNDYDVLDEVEFIETDLPKDLREAALLTLKLLRKTIENKNYPPPCFQDKMHSKKSPLEMRPF